MELNTFFTLGDEEDQCSNMHKIRKTSTFEKTSSKMLDRLW